MALEDEVESLEKVAEEYRPLYVEKNGKFKLDMARITDTVNLRKTLDKERDNTKEEHRVRTELEAKLKTYDGIGDPEKLRGMLAKIEDEEYVKQIMSGKTTMKEIIDKLTQKAREDDQRKVQKLSEETSTWKQRAAKLQSNALNGEIGKAALKAGIHEHAYEDAMLAAKADGFVLDDDAKVVQMDGDTPKLGKDSKTPFSLSEWFEEKKVTKPHWWPAGSSGGGAGGDKGSKGNKVDYSGMSAAQKLSAARANATK
jgi:hypothetical protein